MQPGLTVKNLHVRFSGVIALEAVSLEVEEGEIFSLVGPNGSGKTTLFNCINGFNTPRRGAILYGGVDLLKLPPHQIVTLGISRTFQNLQTVSHMTVLENVLLGAHRRIDGRATLRRWISRRQRQAEEALALEVLDFLGIANYEQRFIGSQPYGIHKLVELARALVARPALVLLDEPAAGMNEQETLEMAKIISEIRTDLGVTVLVVEHDMSLVMQVSDRVCVLDSGQVVTIGEPAAVRRHPRVIEAFLGAGAHA